MSKKREKSESRNGQKNFLGGLQEDTLQGVWSIVFAVLSVFLVLAAFGKAGLVGNKTYSFLSFLFGTGFFLFPALLIILSISFFRSFTRKFDAVRIIGSLCFFVSGLGLVETASPGKGGIVGKLISKPILSLFDTYVSIILLVALFSISLFVISDTNLLSSAKKFWKNIFSFSRKKERSVSITGEAMTETGGMPVDSGTEEVEEKEPEIEAPPKQEKNPPAQNGKLPSQEEDELAQFGSQTKRRARVAPTPVIPIPLSLLEHDKGKPGVGDIKANANIIKRTLQNFGIQVEMDEISIGPSVTRYALKPAEGVKLSRIVALQNDLALALAAHPIRIEAPIPGKSQVGIELPNSIKSTVGLATLLGSPEYGQSDKPLLVALGKGISGSSHFANLAKMPHLLIAGATGSGKSVTIHSIITSLLFRNSPENMKLIMIDPKRVELTLYNKIPHLLTPVITEAKKAILSLKWAAKEMDRRYDILESESVRDIESYHKNVLQKSLDKLGSDKNSVELPETMPYIVIVIDELADIMANYPRELESAIVRLAQMSRAVGIHLVLSTQRPEVKVITGLIKANIPARIALQVSSIMDSRTILDTLGAEKLLGAGDMLYLSGEMSKPIRIQSAFISETEVKRVVKFLADNYDGFAPSDITESDAANGNSLSFSEVSFDGDDDELYEAARMAVVEAGKGSTSYIQRKLRVGYARAARLMDLLEERGVIGPADGAKPREVISGQTDQDGFGERLPAESDKQTDRP